LEVDRDASETISKPFAVTDKTLGMTAKPLGMTDKPLQSTAKGFGTMGKPFGMTDKPLAMMAKGFGNRSSPSVHEENSQFDRVAQKGDPGERRLVGTTAFRQPRQRRSSRVLQHEPGRKPEGSKRCPAQP
jgi:hypothetical protein